MCIYVYVEYNGDVRVGPWIYELAHSSWSFQRRRTRAHERRTEAMSEQRRNPFHSAEKRKRARDSRFIHGQVYGVKKDFFFEM